MTKGEGGDDRAFFGPTGAAVVERMVEAVEEISDILEYRNAFKKQFSNLSRRIKLLAPMFEELRENKEAIGKETAIMLGKLRETVDKARELLRFGSTGSKICLVLDRDNIMERFKELTSQLEHALGALSFDKLELSDEVREQVELVHSQFKRAKERVDPPDAELYSDLLSVYNKVDDADKEPIILKRLAEKLQLTTISDLKQESLALHEMVIASGGEDKGQNIEKMSMLLSKIKDYIQTQNPEMGTQVNAKGQSSNLKTKPPTIPDDFRCPISLELMKDPVIVSTGQTYERDFIEKWLEAGHDSCPKTQQRLSNRSLTTNFVLRSLITQWCELNGLEPPKRPTDSQPHKSCSACTSSECAKINAFIRQLTSCNPEDQREAAGNLRLLAKRNADNRICIAEAGAIPLLVGLLPTEDPSTQENAVTALLNLSIHEENKKNIISSGAVPRIVQVLKTGSMEARENAAATLFSLSVLDENKVTIGMSGAIPALVLLLDEGGRRGKKDAATALFNLCIYQGNKGKAVRAGVIPTLMKLLTLPTGAMVDESLAILAILASHSEGRAVIGDSDAVPVLVNMIGNGSSRNRENAAAVMVHLCSGEGKLQHLTEAHELGLMDLLLDLAQKGTARGKRKAAILIERLNYFLEQQNLACAQVEAQARAQEQAQVHAEQSAQSPPSKKSQSSVPTTSAI